MQTLIELFDERPLENVLSTEMFHPRRTVFICPPEAAANQALQAQLRAYFKRRGVECECIFLQGGMTDAAAVARRIKEILQKYPDCALDIAGGTDAALFASGLVCAQTTLPVFTYSRKNNSFYNIHNAPFAQGVRCPLEWTVEEALLMAGGAARQGRVDNARLGEYRGLFGPLFSLFLRFRREWPAITGYIQRASVPREGANALSADAPYLVKGGQGRRLRAPEAALREMARLGLIGGLEILPGERVRFSFADGQVRAWLRDVGSPLELFVYQACLDTGAFHDVRSSVVVDWPGANQVTNELDVMATSGVKTAFISCKACAVKTEALNELAILRDRFGGQMARAAIVTAERGRAPMRQRAAELNIDVIELEDLKNGFLPQRLRALLRG